MVDESRMSSDFLEAFEWHLSVNEPMSVKISVNRATLHEANTGPYFLLWIVRKVFNFNSLLTPIDLMNHYRQRTPNESLGVS